MGRYLYMVTTIDRKTRERTNFDFRTVRKATDFAKAWPLAQYRVELARWVRAPWKRKSGAS